MFNPAPEDSIPSTPSAPDKVLIGTPGGDNSPLQPPTPPTNLSLAASPRDYFTPSANTSLVPEIEKSLEENASDQPKRRTPLSRRPIFWPAVAVAVVALALVVVLPVYFTVIKPKNLGGGGGPSGGNGGSDSGDPTTTNELHTTGGDGSTVTTENGTEFTYQNQFGGFCAWSPLSSVAVGVVLQSESQGFGIRKIRSMTMLSRTRGRLLSTRRGSGEFINSTGKRPFPSHPSPSPSHVFSELSRHAARPRQCESWRVVCIGTVYLPGALPAIRGCRCD